MRRFRHRAGRALLIAVFVPVSVGTARGQLADTPWPTLNRDRQRTGRTPVVGPQTPTLKWRFQSGGLAYSGIAIGVDGTIYFGSNDHFIYALNPDGTQKWRFETGRLVHSAGPTIGRDGTIYFGSQDNYLYALNPDGTQQWRFWAGESPAHIYGAPAIDNRGVIYFGARHQAMYALDIEGRELWRFPANYFSASPAIGHRGLIYAPTQWQDDRLYCLDRTGKMIWAAGGNRAYSGCMIDKNGVLYLNTFSGILRATNPGGTFRWEVDVGSPLGQPCLGWDGTIYSSGGGLHAVSPEGEILWVSGPGGWSYPVVDGRGTIYVGSNGSEVLAFNPDGSQKWRFRTAGVTARTQFAIDADGTLYFSDYEGWLYALRDPTVAAAITDFQTTYGQHVGGGLLALHDSDDAYVVLASHAFHQLSEPNRAVWTLGGFTGVQSPRLMDVKIEVRLNLPGGVCKVAFRNTATGLFEPYATFETSTQDKVHWITGVPAENYVRDDGRIEMQIKTVIVPPISEATFLSFFDQVQILVRER